MRHRTIYSGRYPERTEQPCPQVAIYDFRPSPFCRLISRVGHPTLVHGARSTALHDASRLRLRLRHSQFGLWMIGISFPERVGESFYSPLLLSL